MSKQKEIRNNYGWAGVFKTWSEQISHSTSEEQMYKLLKKFKENFNEEYGRLSRTKRRKEGFGSNGLD